MTPNGVFLNIGSRKARIARSFLRSLNRIRRQRRPRPRQLSPDEVKRRSRRIKVPSYSSMAFAIGSRLAWRRAIIFRLQKSRRHGRTRRCLGAKKKPFREMSQADKLRHLVPGGKAMDFCNLLEETAHYIKCLNTQIEIMKNIADIYCRSWRWHTVLYTETWKRQKRKKEKIKEEEEDEEGIQTQTQTHDWWTALVLVVCF